MSRVLPVDPDLETEAETHHTWHIKNWTKLPRREHGPKFECAGAPWYISPYKTESRSDNRQDQVSNWRFRRILFFPYGNQVEHASFYLEHGWEENVPEDWYACVQFALVLWNPNHPDIYISNSKAFPREHPAIYNSNLGLIRV